MTKQLDGKVAVVTGAGKGIGRAVARAFAAEGASVVVSDVDAAAAERVAEELDGARAVGCDVRDEQQVAALIDGADPDVVVANAGVGGVPTPVAEMTLDEWRRVTSVNLDGAFLTVKHAAGAMAGNGGGSILTMASITGLGGLALGAGYAAAKAALINLTQTAAVELRDAGVRVNAICPGFCETDLVRSIADDYAAALGLEALDPVIEQAQGRFGEPEEVARVSAFLASDRARFCTGGVYVIDGGMTASLL
jgi:NAD(P)-dependent dehydrogenase (short-subunit alcohol dehydrogenase family)